MSDDLDDHVGRVEELVAKARRYAKEDPEVALSQARKAAEAICRIAFTREVGEPGKIMLDALLQKLVAAKVIPVSIQVPFGTLQAYGNYGSHAQSDARTVDSAYVAPAMAALDQVEAWFFDEYLKRPRGGSVRPATPSSSAAPRRFPVAIVLVAGVAVAGGIAFVVLRHGHDSPPPTPKNAAPVAVAVVDAATAGSAAPLPPDAALSSEVKRAGDLTLHYRILARAPGDADYHLVQRNEALTTDTRVSIQVEVNTPAYVFVVQRQRSNGEVSVLFPEARIPIENPIAKETWVELPPSGKGYRLNDKDLGVETVYLIASRRPLPDLAQAIAGPKRDTSVATQLVAMATAPGDCDKARSLTLDDSSDCFERPRGLEADDEAVATTPPPHSAIPTPGRAVRARPDDDMVLVPFPFRHVAK